MRRLGSYFIWFLLIFASSFTVNVYLILLSQTPPLKPRGDLTKSAAPAASAPAPSAPTRAGTVKARILSRALREPYGLTTGAGDTYYLVDVERRRKRGLVYQFHFTSADADGTAPAELKEVPLKKVRLDFPTDIVNFRDSLYLIEHGEGDEVIKVKTDGSLIKSFHSAKGYQSLIGPKAVAIDLQSGLVYIADRSNRRIVVTSAELDPLRTQTPPKDVASVFQPNGVAIAPDGTVLVTDKSLGRIYRFTADGQYLDFFGGYGAEAGGKFLNPAGLDVGPDGSVYVADSDRSLIEVFNSEGKFQYAWGQKDFGPLFESPRDILVLADGKHILITGGDVEKGGALWLVILGSE